MVSFKRWPLTPDVLPGILGELFIIFLTCCITFKQHRSLSTVAFNNFAPTKMTSQVTF